MIGTLFCNEWRVMLRDGRGRVLLGVGILLVLVSTWTSASTVARQVDPHRLAASGEGN